MLQQKPIIVAALALVLLGILSTLLMVMQATRAADWVEHTLRVQATTNEVLALAIDAETGQRGYLLTRDAAYLSPYNTATIAVNNQLAKLKTLVDDNPDQVTAVGKVARLVQAKNVELATSIALAGEGRVDEAMAKVRQNRGKELMDNLRAEIGALQAQETALYTKRDADAAWTRKMLLLFVISSMIGAMLLAATISATFRDQIAVLDERVKERTQQLEFVTRELAHRSKNLMGIVQSIINLTARNVTTTEEMRTALAARIGGLAKSQDVLIGKNFTGGDLRDLVHGHLATFADPSSFTLAGPDVVMPPTTVQAIGFAMHELGTNASKYGALSVPNGKVSVSWTLVDGVLNLEWSERGGPPVTPPTRRGFGSSVTGAMTERSLNGKVQHDYRPDGLRWTLTFKLDPQAA